MLDALDLGSLFTGIGLMDLGLQRAGMRVRWQAEVDPWCRRVLAQHWRDAERLQDVRMVRAGRVRRVNVLAGGFPCQDVSIMGSGEGLDGERSGLWAEMARIIGELRPDYVIVENVPALRRRGGLGRVLGDLAARGYDAEWDCIPVRWLGGPHGRDRLFVVAYLADPDGRGQQGGSSAHHHHRGDAQRDDVDGRGAAGPWVFAPDDDVRRTLRECTPWEAERPVCRVADGRPGEVDSLRGYGNAVAPPVAEFIGRRVVAHARARGLLR